MNGLQNYRKAIELLEEHSLDPRPYLLTKAQVHATLAAAAATQAAVVAAIDVNSSALSGDAIALYT